jgi:hypothetical protein
MSPVMIYLPVLSEMYTCVTDGSTKQNSAMLINERNGVTKAWLRIVTPEVQFLYKAHIYIEDTRLEPL